MCNKLKRAGPKKNLNLVWLKFNSGRFSTRVITYIYKTVRKTRSFEQQKNKNEIKVLDLIKVFMVNKPKICSS